MEQANMLQAAKKLRMGWIFTFQHDSNPRNKPRASGKIGLIKANLEPGLKFQWEFLSKMVSCSKQTPFISSSSEEKKIA